MTIAAIVGVVMSLAIQSLAAENLMPQGALQKTEEWDDMYDGVDKNGDIHVFTYGEEVMCEGKSPERRDFGASPVWADVTGDSKPELIVGDAYGFLWIFQPSTPPATFPPAFTTGVFVRTFLGNALNIDIGDYDADGLKDVIAGTADGAIQVVKNLGGGVFVKEDSKPNYRGMNVRALGRDQKVDVAGRFPLVMRGQYPLFTGLYAAPRLIDWNRDGKKDMLIGEGGYSANSIYLFINKSQTKEPDYNEAKRNWVAYGNGRENLSPAIGDLDGDGDLDLLVGERVGFLTWFENKPAPEASDMPYLLQVSDKVPQGHVTVGGSDKPAGELPRPHLVDIDGDKDLDLFIGRNDGRIMLSRNIGKANAPVFDTPITLKGVDSAKPRQRPVDIGWDRWDRYNAGNSGFMCIMSSETNLQTGATITFARMCYNYGYVGTGGEIVLSCTVKYDAEYAVTFNARGSGIAGLNGDFAQSLEGAIAGDTVQLKGNNFTARFNPGDQWRTFRQKFRWKRLTEEAKDKPTTGFHLRLSMLQTKGDSYVDIADLKVEETHGEEPPPEEPEKKTDKKTEKKTDKK